MVAGTRPAAGPGEDAAGAGPAMVAVCRWGTPGQLCGGVDAMSRTPAAELARLKVLHRGWMIRRRVVPGQRAGYTAHRKLERGGFQSLQAPTAGELEQALLLAEKGRLDQAGGRLPGRAARHGL
jgi:hypothetical protein